MVVSLEVEEVGSTEEGICALEVPTDVLSPEAIGFVDTSWQASVYGPTVALGKFGFLLLLITLLRLLSKVYIQS